MKNKGKIKSATYYEYIVLLYFTAFILYYLFKRNVYKFSDLRG